MEHEKVKLKREWVKTAAIIFLSILLVLTFFSNTIMNHSLPEVAAQSVESGAINAKIRGSGVVSANEAYEVTTSQTRKVQSVKVRVGDQVQEGDLLFQLEPAESEELKQAQQELSDLELAYQQKILTQNNEDATQQHQLQELRDQYQQALDTFRLYSQEDPDSIAKEIRAGEKTLQELELAASDLETQMNNAETVLAEAKAAEEIRLGKLQTLKDEMEQIKLRIDGLSATMKILEEDYGKYFADYQKMEETAEKTRGAAALQDQMEWYVTNPDRLQMDAGLDQTGAEQCIRAYNILTADLNAVLKYLDAAPDIAEEQLPEEEHEAPSGTQIPASDANQKFELRFRTVSAAQKSQITICQQNLAISQQEYEKISGETVDISGKEAEVHALKTQSVSAAQAVIDQQKVVSDLQTAGQAAQNVKDAEKTLEDKLFEMGLADPESLALDADKKRIQQQKDLIDQLTKEADGMEILSKVSGTVSEIRVSPGGTAEAESPIALITVADRGYIVHIPVTNEQARQVHIGDSAEVTNFYWGNITATLENIAPDPDSQGKGKYLLFRISGDGIEAGANLSLSIGQKSANYDALIPNSAVRTDSNGTFVLVVQAKSSPLGNRYIASRADVKVLASDDTRSAISGLGWGDYVITTSTRPLEAGTQVRLVDE